MVLERKYASKGTSLLQYLAFTACLLKIVVMTLCIRIFRCLPVSRKVYEVMGDKTGMTKAGMTVDDWAFTAGGWEFFKALVTAAYESTIVVPVTVTPGGDAANCQLISSDGTTRRELFDFMRPERPLVVNFGSCT